MSKAVIITSIKGGVGKTTVSASLAYSLSSLGYKVLAVDMDLTAGGLDVALGCDDKITIPVTDCISSRSSLSDAVISTRYENLSFLSSPMERSSFVDISREKADAFIASMKSRFDYVIFDTPAGGGEYFDLFASSPETDLVNIVTTDSTLSIRAAEKTAYELAGKASPECSVRMIINGYDLDSPSYNSRGIISLIFAVKASLIGIVPFEPDAEKFTMEGTPISAVKKSYAGKALMNTALRITGRNVPVMEGIVPKRRRKKFY